MELKNKLYRTWNIDNRGINQEERTVGFWHSDDNELSNWFNDRTENEDSSFLDILSYRIAED